MQQKLVGAAEGRRESPWGAAAPRAGLGVWQGLLLLIMYNLYQHL